MMHRCAQRALAMATLLLPGVGCEGVVKIESQPAADELPRLERVLIPALDSIGPERGSAMLALSENGRLAYTTGFDPDNRLITVIDTTGRVLHRLAPNGNGPGELASPMFAVMAYHGDSLIVLDPGKQRLFIFAGNGSLLNASPVFEGGMGLRLAADSSDFLLLDVEGNAMIQGIARLSTITGKGRKLNIARKTAADSIDVDAPNLFSARNLVVTSESSVVVVNSRSYRFARYTTDGIESAQWRRDIPKLVRTEAEIDSALKQAVSAGGFDPRSRTRRPITARELELREEFLRQPLPRFFQLRFDRQGRLWTTGVDDAGQTFGDVFFGERWLGRIMIPCEGPLTAIEFGGAFMAAMCKAPSRDAGVELQVFRVVNSR